MRTTTQPASQQPHNAAKKQLKSKKQMQQDLLALYQSKSRYFRVFYDILEEDGTSIQDLDPSSYTLLKRDARADDPFYEPGSISDQNHPLLQQSSAFSPLYESEIYKWFDSLTLCQRVNALTCTSPFLSEVLANMYRTQQKKNGTLPIWFAQSNKKPNIQNFIMESSLKHYKDQSDPELVQLSKYGQQYYLGSSGYSSKFGKYSEASALGFSDFDSQMQKHEHVRLYPQFFEDLYYSRCMHYTEHQQKRINEPFKFYSQEALVKCVRFCDMYQYIDTISVDFGLVADSKQFFDILSNCSEGNAFTTKCKFVFSSQLGVHLIESPYWFKPDKFNTLASWLASIFEENLWANFTLHEIMTSKNTHDKQQASLDYLFDFKQLQVVKETQQLVSIQNLANAWLNAPADKRSEITQSVQERRTIEEQATRGPNAKRLRDIYVRRDFFLSDHKGDLTIGDAETQHLIDKSLKACSKQQKFRQVYEFITELFMSPLSHIELPKDVLHRHLLKLIIDLHQDMLIQELIGSNQHSNPQKKEKKRKKKKADKQNPVLIQNEENKDTVEFNNNIKVDQNMAQQPPLKQRSFDQRSKQQPNQSKETLSYESFMIEKHSDMSVHTCKEPDHDVSEGEQLLFKDPINPDAEPVVEDIVDKEQLKFDMHMVSNNYISSMLLRIEQEIKSNDEFKVIQDASQRKNKKKKAKKQQTTKEKGPDQTKAQVEIPQTDRSFQAEPFQMAEQIEELVKSSSVAIPPKSSHVRQKTIQLESAGNHHREPLVRTIDPAAAPERKPNANKKNKKQKAAANKQAFDDDAVFEPGSALPKLSEDLMIQKNSSLVVADTQKFNRFSHLSYQNQSATNSRMSSRQQSPINTTSSVNNPEATDKSTQGRRRNRKKNKAALDPEEVMNQFIIQLNSKKDTDKKSIKSKPSFAKAAPKMPSRKASETRGPGQTKPAASADEGGNSAKPKSSKQSSVQQVERQQNNEGNSLKNKSNKRPAGVEVTVLDATTTSDKANAGQSFLKKSNIKWTQNLGREVEETKFDQHEKDQERKASKHKGQSQMTLESEQVGMVSASLKAEKQNNTVVESKKFSSLVNETVSELTLNNKEDSISQLQSYLQPSPQGQTEKQGSKINTNSPSFKPSKASLATDNDQDVKTFDHSLALSQQNTSLEKMSFDLNNIKSFNPTNFQKKKSGQKPQNFKQDKVDAYPASALREQMSAGHSQYGLQPQTENNSQQMPKTSVVNISEQLGLSHQMSSSHQFNRQRAQFNESEISLRSNEFVKCMVDGTGYTPAEMMNMQPQPEMPGLVSSMPAVPNANIHQSLVNQGMNHAPRPGHEDDQNLSAVHQMQKKYAGQPGMHIPHQQMAQHMSSQHLPTSQQAEEHKSKDQTRSNNNSSNSSAEANTTISFQQRQANPNPNGESLSHQMNSFNINVFGNLNIGQLVSTNSDSPKQNLNEQDPMHLGNQFTGVAGVPLMNMQLSQVNNMQSQPGNPQFMNVNQSQGMYQNYQHQFYDYNLSQTIEFKFYEKFDNDIYDEVNRIQQKIDVHKEERNYVLNKLQKMCEQVFAENDESAEKTEEAKADENKQAPVIMQFGSLMTGLALETSDMDMAVTNLFLPDRQKMIDCLDLFADYLRKWDIIKDLNAISTASIPVIKGNIDLKVLRAKEMQNLSQDENKSDKMQDFGDCQNDVMPKDSKRSSSKDKEQISNDQQFLKIDITFDDNMNASKEGDTSAQDQQPYTADISNALLFNINQKTHQGLASSQLIKNYVEHYKCLKEVSIILKQFLARMDLNSPYHGGISSYSTVILLIAYMNKWNLKASSTLTPSRLLMGFLDYYSYYFNASLFGIDVSNSGSFYALSSPEANIVILDPLNCQNNTSRNSFLTHEIIKSYRKAFNILKNLLMYYQQAKSQDIQENLLEVIMQRQESQQQENFMMPPQNMAGPDMSGFMPPMHQNRF